MWLMAAPRPLVGPAVWTDCNIACRHEVSESWPTHLDAGICCACIVGQVRCQLVHSGAHAHQLPQIGSRHLAHSAILQQNRQGRGMSTDGRPLLGKMVVIHPLSGTGADRGPGEWLKGKQKGARHRNIAGLCNSTGSDDTDCRHCICSHPG